MALVVEAHFLTSKSDFRENHMGFISLSETARAATGRQGRSSGGRKLPTGSFTVAVHRVKQSSGFVFALAIGVYPKAAQAARLQRGDRVDILFDPTDGVCLLVRNNDGQWSLSKKTRHLNKATAIHMQATIRHGMPYFGIDEKMRTEIVEWSIDAETGGIVFQLPRHPAAAEQSVGW